MAELDQNFEVFAGDHADVDVSLYDADGNALDLTGAILRWGLGPMDASPPKILKSSEVPDEIEISSTEDGVIATIHLVPGDTRLLLWMARHELQLIDANGKFEMLMTGTVRINASALAQLQGPATHDPTLAGFLGDYIYDNRRELLIG